VTERQTDVHDAGITDWPKDTDPGQSWTDGTEGSQGWNEHNEDTTQLRSPYVGGDEVPNIDAPSDLNALPTVDAISDTQELEAVDESGAGAAGAAGATAVSAAEPAATVRERGVYRTRKARLRLARVDPWSVMKTAFLFAIAGGIIFWVATYVVWAVIGASGLFDAVNRMVDQVLSTPGQETPFRVEDYVSTNKVLGLTALIAAIDIVLMTALATLGSFLYNLSATILGGLEITLAED